MLTFTIIVRSTPAGADATLRPWNVVMRTEDVSAAGQLFTRLRTVFAHKEGVEAMVVAQKADMPGMQRCIGKTSDAEMPLLSSVHRLNAKETDAFWQSIDLIEKTINAIAQDARNKHLRMERIVHKFDKAFALCLSLLIAIPCGYLILDIGSTFVMRALAAH